MRLKEDFLIAVNRSAFSELKEAVMAGDDHGLKSLIFSGKAFMVKGSTQVLVLDNAFEKSNVRVLEGSHKERSGWILNNCLY